MNKNASNSLTIFEDWLLDAANYEKTPKKGQFSLETINYLVKRFNNPQNSFKSVHVAGSKGKGSVSTMIASILKATGYTTGLYTSPHILDFAERFTNVHEFLDEEIYQKSAKELIPSVNAIIPEHLTSEEPSWFELVTLFSFLCFKNMKAEWAVYESGLGGRFDATNVLKPQLCVITPIELEHTEYLGDTIEKIAFEKAGIIKENTPLCLFRQKKEALEVFKSIAKEKNAQLYYLPELIKSINYNITNKGMQIFLEFNKDSPLQFLQPIDCTLPLIGKIQAENAALAVVAAKIILPDVTEKIIEKGLSTSKISGRFEIINILYNNSYNLTLILDGAHTEESIKLTMETFTSLFKNEIKEKKAGLLFAIAADKKVEKIAPLLNLTFNSITLTKPGSKLTDMQKAAKAFESYKNVIIQEDCSLAIADTLTRAAQNNGVALITGSFYLLAEVKKFLSSNRNFSVIEG